MNPAIVARMGIKVAKAGAYQNLGLMMAKKIVMMVQMKKSMKKFMKKVGRNSEYVEYQSTYLSKVIIELRILKKTSSELICTGLSSF